MASILDIILNGTSGDAQVWVLPNVRGEGRERWIGARDSDRLDKYGKKQDQAGHGIFFCVSTIRHKMPRKKENAVELSFLFADIDFKHIDLTPEEILERLLALPHPPSRVHHTGHGYHCFWILETPAVAEDFERAEALLKRLAYLVGGDIQVCHRAALLRLPGSHNTKKRDERKLVQVVRETNATYGLDEMDRWLSSVSAPIIPKTGAQANPFLQAADNQASKPPVDVEARLAAMQVNGGDINGVHPSQLSITASLTSKGMDEDEIVEIVLGATKELAGTSDWNWTREEQAIRAMCRDASKKFDARKRKAKPLSSDVVSLKSATPGDKGKDDDAPDEAIAPAYSDEALALRFTARYPNLRFTAKWNQWSIFDGTRWKTDETRAVFSCARIVCREAAREANAAKAAKAIASSKTRNAVVSMASDDRRMAATVDQWDTDVWLLNTPGGTIDLRVGEMRLHRLEDYMTKITAVSPDPSCPTPLFDKFLDRVTESNEEYESFLQRMCGYGLTGSTRDHALFFLHGGGRNGKGTFVRTIGGIMGDYHCTAPTEAFMDTKNERHPTELAMLRGARLVTSTETEEGRAWAESLVKKLTGGDPIDARFMRQDFFRYTPQFKLVMQGNHKPSLKSVDVAMRARLNLLPFAVTIPPEERDTELETKLKAEWPGIMAWMVEGCMEWQRHGLSPPEIVTSATDTYLDEQDSVGRWVDELCERDPNAFTLVHELYASWDTWADSMGLFRMDGKRFSQRLEAMGFVRENRPRHGGRGFRGIKGPMVSPNTFRRVS